MQVISPSLLSEFTTFRLGGPCKGMVHCVTPEELTTVVGEFSGNKQTFILIGGGSNLVVSDHGVDCFVIRYLSEKPLIKREGNDVIVSGSTLLDDLAQVAAEEGLAGLEYATGIPGTVGGAVVGNAGAFGRQIGDVLVSAEILTVQGQKKVLQRKDLGFSYRHSNLKETDDIVVSIRLALQEGDTAELLEKRRETLQIRKEKHPDLQKDPCAGSFFRNIEPTSKAGQRQATGWFLDQAGGKSLRHGGAFIYPKHANIIVKGKDCKAQDVFELSKMMAKLIKDSYNLELVREVRFVGIFEGRPSDTNGIIW